jgi:amino acid transporter
MYLKKKLINNRNVYAWLLMITAIALHVFDETKTDFLPAYNNIVLNIREQIKFFPAPTFSFNVWLVGLVGGIILGFVSTYFVARGGKVIRTITLILGCIMVLNAILHFIGSLYFDKIFPGTLSSPFLLAAALFVVYQGFKGDWQVKYPKMKITP